MTRINKKNISLLKMDLKFNTAIYYLIKIIFPIQGTNDQVFQTKINKHNN